ncbi:hypothetical protein [Pseudoduganella namucuonensis]|uniref:Uncharacterized protein n=1 Tax=Pseudoduganella namucuonensis TaxID=1035707 RepID=A0A1I7M888_9BURK|nr:hypothetical protein [Pseudoduganella namucuonensis]SFV18138.1 hypothetical protein SAMN05216552_11002 [Pseudoduganella namucuonensis]
MAYYILNLKANKPYPQTAIGRVLLIDSIGVSPGVDVTLVVNDAEQRVIPGRRGGFKYVAGYTGVIFTSPVDCVLRVFLTMNEVDLGYVDGVQVEVTGNVGITNTALNPVPVDVMGATMTATDVGINNDNANAVPVQRQALSVIGAEVSVAVGVAAVSASNDATLKRIWFRNTNAVAQIALGASGVTMDSPIILGPGDIYFEEDGAGAHWYAISDTAGSTLVTLGMK